MPASLYTDELADKICERIMSGESMRSICEDDDMPDRATLLRWMSSNEAFAAKCARARDIQADFLFDQMQEVADSGNADDVQRAKLRVSTMQWRASKLAPKKYGDKLTTEVTGANGGPVETVNWVAGADEELLKKVAALKGA